MAVRASSGSDLGPVATDFDWIDRSEGVLCRGELENLVVRLGSVPAGVRRILLDWRSVSHLDFRGLSPLVSRLRGLRDRGIEIRCVGVDAYLRAILRFSLPEEEFELFAGCVGGEGHSSAGARAVGIVAVLPHLSVLGISKN